MPLLLMFHPVFIRANQWRCTTNQLHVLIQISSSYQYTGARKLRPRWPIQSRADPQYVTPPQRKILDLTRGRSDELFVPTNPLSQQTLRPDEFFVPTEFVPTNYLSRQMLRPDELCVPTNYVFIGRKGSSGRTHRQFDYFALRGGDILSIGSRLWILLEPL